MLRPFRIIPILLIADGTLVKSAGFRRQRRICIGDPANSLRIFNELEVDELFLLDIDASRFGRSPNIELLGQIASECFMPLAYGGAITSLHDAEQIVACGIEKVVLNSGAIDRPSLITEISTSLGSQAVVVAADYKVYNGVAYLLDHRKQKRVRSEVSLTEWLKRAEDLGAGELLVTAVDHEASWQGPDLQTLGHISNDRNIPVVYQGGIGKIDHIRQLRDTSILSGVAVGSMAVFSSMGGGVLVHLPAEVTGLLNTAR
jgi:cyclase